MGWQRYQKMIIIHEQMEFRKRSSLKIEPALNSKKLSMSAFPTPHTLCFYVAVVPRSLIKNAMQKIESLDRPKLHTQSSQNENLWILLNLDSY